MIFQELTGLPSLSSKVFLPLSALVKSYCRVNPQCAKVKEVTDFIDILRKNIDDGCKADQKNFKTVCFVLSIYYSPAQTILRGFIGVIALLLLFYKP